MNKDYKISYKTYPNNRLKPTNFHGFETYPLYIQVTYMRKSIFFKSYLFELLSAVRFSGGYAKKIKPPLINEVVQMENDLLKFVTNILSSDFTLEEFKQTYHLYSQDLCHQTEEDFRVYMFMFFINKGLKTLAHALADKSRDYVLYTLLKDMKTSMVPDLYNELIDGAIPYGPFAAPYLLLYDYISQIKGKSFLLLTVKEWSNRETRQAFIKFLSENYPDENEDELLSLIDERVAVLKEEKNNNYKK